MEIEYVHRAPVVYKNYVHVVVSYHGPDDQRITVWVTDMACVHFTKGDKVRLTSELFGRLLVGRAPGWNRPFPGLSKVVVLGPSRFPCEMWSAEDRSDHAGRFCLLSVLAGLGAPITDIALKVPLSNEFFDLILECDAFFCGVANILVVPAVLVLVSF